MIKNTARFWFLPMGLLLLLAGTRARAITLASALTFSPGDVFVSLESGQVQWRLPNGMLNRILVGTVPGTGEGMGFDTGGNLYVSRWCIDPWCSSTGDTVEKFNSMGQSLGSVGSGYDCAPHAIVFDAIGSAY